VKSQLRTEIVIICCLVGPVRHIRSSDKWVWSL